MPNNKKITASLEDYLEAIYNIIEEKQSIKAIDISKKLCVSRSSVTEAMKNLADKKLINYGRYDIISLTPAGINIAKKVITKHKILQDFFEKTLGVTSKEAQENACKVEHVISDEILNRLIAFNEFNNNFYCGKKKYTEEFQNFYTEFNRI